mmetsp:Transcript_32377/g.78687  ORF Transcript_32377/g.78687 Transcript_32377/m.78687 type:complete len:185 (-) Transcript_32377:1707-2261(-)
MNKVSSWALRTPTVGTIFRQQQHGRQFSQLAENQIAAWLRQGGEQDLQNKGKKLEGDRHQKVASALGVGDDYIHSKILSDNNFKPESIERRLDLDKKWEELQYAIRKDFEVHQGSFPSVEEYAKSSHAKDQFEEAIAELDAKAKKVNDAVISDSLRFNGRSPVPHARRFRLQERIEEAIDQQSK